ncbi:MAG: hypothetical protein FWF24_00005, partial [Alphaproteobacteria bacterium]|nr:hypothetical protein [Alphaproteobacteria bacterium]
MHDLLKLFCRKTRVWCFEKEHRKNSCISARVFSGEINNKQAGFAVAPVLYLLVLAGVVAGVLFSGYSQVLRSGINVSNTSMAKTDMAASMTTLAATSVLSQDQRTFCPPGSAERSEDCEAAPIKLQSFESVTEDDIARLPVDYGLALSGSDAFEAGVFVAAASMKVLDPWGRFYIYCRWENARAAPDSPAFRIITAGANGRLETSCNDETARGDDQMQSLSVGAAIQRAAIWQDQGTFIEYGQTGSKVLIGDDGTISAQGINVSGIASFGNINLSTPLGVGSGGTGASNSVGARVNLGAGSVGDAVFTSGSTSQAVDALGAGSVGKNVFFSNTTDTAQDALGASAVGKALFTAPTASDGRQTLGSGSIGDSVFVAGSTDEALGALGAGNIGKGVFTSTDTDSALNSLGAGSFGRNVFYANDAPTVRQDLGAGALGEQLFLASDQTTAWSLLGLTGDGTIDVNITGEAGSVKAGNIIGIVPVVKGGTGADTETGALNTLFSGDTGGSSYLNMGRIADRSIAPQKLQNIVTAGRYYSVDVDTTGLVTGGSANPPDFISDGEGQAIGTSNDPDGGLLFYTASLLRMIINKAGDVGIGTATPGAKLQVHDGSLRISGPAATYRDLQYATGTDQMRWAAGADETPEGGSDTGSNYRLTRYLDDGSAHTALIIDRATGNAAFEGGVTAAGGFSGYFTGTFDGSFIGDIDANVFLGESATVPNPYRKGESTTGLFSAASGQVSVASAGVERLRVSADGLYVDGDSLTSGSIFGAAAALGSTSITTGSVFDMSAATNSMIAPLGTTGQRPAAPVEGMLRYNTTLNRLEAYQGFPPSWETLSPNDATFYLGTSATQTYLSREDDVTTGLYSDAASQVQVAIAGTERLRVTGAGAYVGGNIFGAAAALGSTSITVGSVFDMSAATNSMIAPTGTTGERPAAPVAGMLRYNTTLNRLEVYQGFPPEWDTLSPNDAEFYLGTSATQTYLSRQDDETTGLYSDAAERVQVAIAGTERLRVTGTGAYVTGNIFGSAAALGSTSVTAGSVFDMSAATNSMIAPTGTTGERPAAPVEGMLRYNTTLNRLEVYQGDPPEWDTLSPNDAEFYLGTSATQTYLSREDDETTGLYSDAASQVQVAIAGTERLRVSATGAYIIGNSQATGSMFASNAALGSTSVTVGSVFDMSAATNSMIAPLGTTGQRPAAPVEGMLRYNTTLNRLEVYQGSPPNWDTLSPNDAEFYLGTSATQTYLSRADDVTTGLYSDAASQVQVSIAGTERLRVTGTGLYVTGDSRTSGNIFGSAAALGSTSITTGSVFDMSAATNSMIAPTGTTGERPAAPVEGMLRYNTTLNRLEVYQGFPPSWDTLSPNDAEFYLGTSATQTYLSREDDVTTGLYSDAASQVQVAIAGTERLRVSATGAHVTGNSQTTGSVFASSAALGATSVTTGSVFDMSAATNSMIAPTGTTGERPAAPVEGMLRYNTTLNRLEVYQGFPPNWDSLSPNDAAFYLGTSATKTYLSRQDDETTGLYSDAASQVQVAIAGTERLRVTGTGAYVTGNIFGSAAALGSSSVTDGSVLDMSAATNSMIAPKGTIGERPAPA